MKPRMAFECQLVVADLVGTTLDDDGAVETALAAAVREHGLIWQPQVFARLRGRTKREAITGMIEAQQSAGVHPEQVHGRFITLLVAHYRRGGLPWVRGADEAVRALAAAGIRFVLATGFPAEIRDAVAAQVPWHDCLTAFLSANDVRNGRPAPDLVLEAMRRSGVHDPLHVAVVGDTPADAACGRAAGAGMVIAVENGACPRPMLEEAGPDLLLPSIADLVRALGYF